MHPCRWWCLELPFGQSQIAFRGILFKLACLSNLPVRILILHIEISRRRWPSRSLQNLQVVQSYLRTSGNMHTCMFMNLSAYLSVCLCLLVCQPVWMAWVSVHRANERLHLPQVYPRAVFIFRNGKTSCPAHAMCSLARMAITGRRSPSRSRY
jgi:hypothetical protein